MPGPVFTVKVAALLLVELTVLVNTARYSFPSSAEAVVNEYVVLVAPETLFHEVPPSVLTCHCTVGVGFPLAAAVNETPVPAFTVWLVGFVVMLGPVFTVKVAGLLFAEFTLLVKAARYSFPLSVEAVVNEYVVLVAPTILFHVEPPSVLTCHWTVGEGFPLAAAVNDPLLPALTVWFVGFVVTLGAKSTVSVAALLLVELTLFVNTARYSFPLSVEAVVNEYVVLVAPVTLLHVEPPFVLTSHWTAEAAFRPPPL